MNQSGSMQGDSTVNQLVNIYHNTCASLDEHKKHTNDIFDMSKSFVCLFLFHIPSTARSFRDGTPIYCPLRRT